MAFWQLALKQAIYNSILHLHTSVVNIVTLLRWSAEIYVSRYDFRCSFHQVSTRGRSCIVHGTSYENLQLFNNNFSAASVLSPGLSLVAFCIWRKPELGVLLDRLPIQKTKALWRTIAHVAMVTGRLLLPFQPLVLTARVWGINHHLLRHMFNESQMNVLSLTLFWVVGVTTPVRGQLYKCRSAVYILPQFCSMFNFESAMRMPHVLYGFH